MNKTLKRSLKIIGIAIGSFIGFCLLYFAAAWGLSRVTVNKNPEPHSNITIYILTNGAHTDIVVPVRTETIDWSRLVSFDNTIGKDTTARYAAFGWGDKGFYLDTPTWADLKVSTAFKATFALSTSAMHVTFYKRMHEGADCKSIGISLGQYEQLVKYITEGFEKDSAGNFIHIVTDANYGANDAFYEGIGRYNLFHTCNTWANNALKACGQRAALWTPFESGVFYHYTE